MCDALKCWCADVLYSCVVLVMWWLCCADVACVYVEPFLKINKETNWEVGIQKQAKTPIWTLTPKLITRRRCFLDRHLDSHLSEKCTTVYFSRCESNGLLIWWIWRSSWWPEHSAMQQKPLELWTITTTGKIPHLSAFIPPYWVVVLQTPKQTDSYQLGKTAFFLHENAVTNLGRLVPNERVNVQLWTWEGRCVFLSYRTAVTNFRSSVFFL